MVGAQRNCVSAPESEYLCYIFQGDQMNSLLKLDLRDTDSNYAVDMRDKSIIVSEQTEIKRGSERVRGGS